MVHHSKEDTLEKGEFERLLSACEKTSHPRQNRFLVLVMGRLGLRAAEVAHMKDHWLLKQSKLIRIPNHEPCDCCSCRAQAKQRVEVTNRKALAWDMLNEGSDTSQVVEKTDIGPSLLKKIKKMEERPDTLSLEEAMQIQWRAKTENSARPVPYNLEDRTEEIVEEVIDEYGGCPVKRFRINKRVDKVAKLAGFDPMKVYPHALRATAAFNLAYLEVTPYQLMNWMGWNQLNTAMKYIKASGVMVKSAVKNIREDQ